MNLTFLIFVTYRWPAVLLAARPHSVRRQQKNQPLGWLLTRPGDRPPYLRQNLRRAASSSFPLRRPPPPSALSVDYSNSK
jgi:hypothetical protein